jgi:hypothetical protein
MNVLNEGDQHANINASLLVKRDNVISIVEYTLLHVFFVQFLDSVDAN